MKLKILYYCGWSLTRVISTLIFRIQVSGQEHIPSSGGFILASNHTSYFDPLLVGSWATREVYFFAKEELFRNKVFGEVIRRTNALPVKRGTIDRDAIKAASSVIERGEGLTIFPEGTRGNHDKLLSPKPGIGLIATSAPCPIVPVYIHGASRLWDCFLGRMRMSITYGAPISEDWVRAIPAEKDGYLKIAAKVMEEIITLRDRVESKGK